MATSAHGYFGITAWLILTKLNSWSWNCLVPLSLSIKQFLPAFYLQTKAVLIGDCVPFHGS